MRGLSDSGREYVQHKTPSFSNSERIAMTDIDALIAEANKYITAKFDNSPYEAKLLSGLIDAFTAERAKVAALEAEATRWREAKADPVAWAYVNPDGECEQIEWGPVPDDPHVTPLYAPPSPPIALQWRFDQCR